jgi:hypothetical protein
LLRSIPAPTVNPGNQLRLPGFLTKLVAGTRNHLKLLFQAVACLRINGLQNKVVAFKFYQ